MSQKKKTRLEVDQFTQLFCYRRLMMNCFEKQRIPLIDRMKQNGKVRDIIVGKQVCKELSYRINEFGLLGGKPSIQVPMSSVAVGGELKLDTKVKIRQSSGPFYAPKEP